MYLKQKQQNKPILTYANKQNKVLTDTYPNIECVCVFVYLSVCVHGSYQCQFQGEFLRKSYGTHSQILKDNVMYFLSLHLSPCVSHRHLNSQGINCSVGIEIASID